MHAKKVERVRGVLSQRCHRCMTESPIGSHLCATCYLPIFYEKILPTVTWAVVAALCTARSRQGPPSIPQCLNGTEESLFGSSVMLLRTHMAHPSINPAN